MNRLLRIRQLPMGAGSLADVRATLRRCEKDGHRVSLLIVDSPDHFRGTSKRYHDSRAESTEVYRGLKGLMTDFPLATAAITWVAKQWEGKVATKQAVADNYEKVKVADWFSSINALRVEGVEVAPGKEPLWLYVGKRRAGECNILVPLAHDFARMRMDTEPEGGT